MKDLENLVAYCGVSKITGKVFMGYDSTVESDLTRLKKGIRSRDSLGMHEAYYIVMSQQKVIDLFRQKFSDVRVRFTNDNMYMINRCKSQINHGNQVIEDCKNTLSNGAEETKRNYIKFVANWQHELDAYNFLKQYEADAEAVYDQLPKNRSKLIDWKNLTSIQFYQYDAATNSFVELN